MAALHVCLAFLLLLTSSAVAYRRPLGDFINHYETLNYDTARVVRQHSRVRRSSPNSDHVVELHLKTEQSKPRHKNSLVHGFISDDGVFEGKIHVGNDKYFVESAKEYFKDEPNDFHSVIYESRDVNYPHAYGPGCGVSEKTKKWMDKVKRYILHLLGEIFITLEIKGEYGPQLIDLLTCTYQADHLFTANMADGNKERAMLLMADHVKAANSIFKNTDFSGNDKADGIQFQIQRMLANGTAEANDGRNPYRDSNIGVEKLLELNSEEIHDDVCLSYIFTYRDFADGVLGLAWVGEAVYLTKYINVIAILLTVVVDVFPHLGGAAGGICETATSFRDGKTKSLNTGVVTFVNYNKKVLRKVSEITFAHEAGHNFGSPHDNSPECAPGGTDGNYIMFARATSGDQKNNRLFSPCSRTKMNEVMDVKGRCTSNSCCFRDAQGAICGNMVTEAGEECDCGYKTDESCKKDTCCVGRDVNSEGSGCKRRYNATCSGINATCPVPAPKANFTSCNEGRQVCIQGECSGSICLKFNKLECQCAQENHLCDLCCKDGEEGKCLPASEIKEMKEEKNLKQFPGAPCNDFNGYCDVFLKCRAVDADGPLSRLKNKFFSKEAIKGYLEWIKEYWWAVVLMGVGLILLMAGFIKLCSVHTPSSNPNRKPARQLTLRRQPARGRPNQRGRQMQQGNRGNPQYDDPPPYPGAPMQMHGR
ncbi:Disintegrin and metalloproteinase domain-containing protein 10 [Stylophora pistillata]|uniref:ADAM10 endopeptidase n=1 Tax=Stylophora pistillata TaxID=50429 RepID=A0A2B4RV56_STYPI|nr:Disintegrin and metalloproteinase domain-containing protein 10 [Stylophora pistillata]